MNYDERGSTMKAWRREDTVVAARMEPEHEQTTIQQQEYAKPRAVLDPASAGQTLDLEFNTVIQAFHQEFDTVIRTAFADAMSRAAKIKSKAEAEAEILLRQAHNEKAQLEAEVASLRQERDRLARTLSQTLLSLEQGLQAMTSALGQVEEQVKQQMQVLQAAGIQLGSLEPTIAEEPVGPEEEAIGEYRAPEKEAAEKYEIPVEGASEEYRMPVEEATAEYRMPEEEKAKAIEEYGVTKAYQPVSETRVRIIGLRQIAWLHRIEKALAADPAVEDVRTIKYSEGVLIMAVRHQPISLVGILKGVQGLSVQDVREVGEWIEVYLGDTIMSP